MPSQKEYNNLKIAVKNLTLQRASLRAKQREDISNGLYYKNGLLNNVRGGMDNNQESRKRGRDDDNDDHKDKKSRVDIEEDHGQDMKVPQRDPDFDSKLANIQRSATDFQNITNPTLPQIREALSLIDASDDNIMGSIIDWGNDTDFRVVNYYNLLRGLQGEIEAENEESDDDPLGMIQFFADEFYGNDEPDLNMVEGVLRMVRNEINRVDEKDRQAILNETIRVEGGQDRTIRVFLQDLTREIAHQKVRTQDDSPPRRRRR